MNPGVPGGPGDKLLAPKREIFFNLRWLGQEFIDLMATRAPGLPQKLSELRPGEVPNLTEAEEKFFVDLVTEGHPSIDIYLTGLAGQIWEAHMLTWEDNAGVSHNKTMDSDLWEHFPSAVEILPEEATKLIRFFLRSTKAQAEKIISHWPEWKDRKEIRLTE